MFLQKKNSGLLYIFVGYVSPAIPDLYVHQVFYF